MNRLYINKDWSTLKKLLFLNAAKAGATPKTETLSGSIVTFSTTKAVPLIDCKADINPVQDLNGYGNPWPDGGGVNKLPPPVDGTYESNGFKAVVKDGVITFSGTTTATVNLSIPLSSTIHVSNGMYLHFLNTVAIASLAPSFELSTSPGTTATSVSLSPENRIYAVTNSDVNWDRIRFYIVSGVAASGTMSPMLCADNVARSFSPYSNICSITGWTGAKVIRTGTNVWNEEWENGDIGSATGLDEPDNRLVRTKNYISIVGGASYFAKIGNVSSSTNLRARFYDANKTYIGYLQKNGNPVKCDDTFVAPDNARYMRFATPLEYGNTYNNDISINCPATVTSYSPYTGQTVDVQFPSEAGTVYGGTLDVTTGELVVDRRIVTANEINSSENSKISPVDVSHGMWVYRVDNAEESLAVTTNEKLLCNILPTSNQNYLYNSGNGGRIGCAIWWSKQLGIATNDITVNNISLFKQWCVDNNIVLIYPLATPLVYHLTPQEITALSGDNTMWADTGDITVTYRK